MIPQGQAEKITSSLAIQHVSFYTSNYHLEGEFSPILFLKAHIKQLNSETCTDYVRSAEPWAALIAFCSEESKTLLHPL